MAKDRTPATGKGSTARKGAAGSGAGTRGQGRTRPVPNVVTQQRRPWGLIAAAVVVAVLAAAVLTYAVLTVNKANAEKIRSLDQIAGVDSFDYAAGQEHVTTDVEYKESPPVGGPHDPNWADCTGTVYDVDIRHENAVHSLEHGAVWVTYNPDELSAGDIKTLSELVENHNYRMMSPYAGLDSPISLQAWNRQLKVSSAGDVRIKQFADFMTLNGDIKGHYPEVGASCENPAFAANPVVEGSNSTPTGPTDMPTSAPASSEPPKSSAP